MEWDEVAQAEYEQFCEEQAARESEECEQQEAAEVAEWWREWTFRRHW